MSLTRKQKARRGEGLPARTDDYLQEVAERRGMRTARAAWDEARAVCSPSLRMQARQSADWWCYEIGGVKVTRHHIVVWLKRGWVEQLSSHGPHRWLKVLDPPEDNE